MSYAAALALAWDGLIKAGAPETISVKFLADEYSVDLKNKQVLSLACNAPAKDYAQILILHYLRAKLKGLPEVSGKWLTFRELSGVEGYQPAFRQRVIERIIRKYGSNPDALLSVLERSPGRKINQGDVGIVLGVFAGVPALIELWRADKEFSPEANLLFDQNVTKIFCIEDIVVLAEFIASHL